MTHNNKRIAATLVSMAAGVSLFGGMIAPANAQTATTTPAAAARAAKMQANQAARLAKVIARSDKAINDRVTSLNNLNTRIQALKNVSATEKATISTEIQTNVSGLTSLKAKIDADTDLTTAVNDEKTITSAYRVYELVIPRGYIEASVDRITEIATAMTSVGTKLQTRVTTAQTAGKDVTALQAALSDYSAKISDATTQANAAKTAVASLVPDQGDKTVLAANNTALKTARADIKTATTDLQAARADAQTVSKGLRALNVKVKASVKTSTTTNQ